MILQKLKEEFAPAYIEQGRQEGKLEGRIEGLQEGRVERRQEGIQEGKIEGMREMINSILIAKFGNASVYPQAKLNQMDTDEINRLMQKIIPANSPEELFN